MNTYSTGTVRANNISKMLNFADQTIDEGITIKRKQTGAVV